MSQESSKVSSGAAQPSKIALDGEERRVREIVEQAFANGDYRRIYHYHIRKTAGTTINFAFLGNSGVNPNAFYDELAKAPGRRLIAENKKVFVGWNGTFINEGYYFYAFSHGLMHRLRVPPGTFTITCLRDPLKRVISHYNMLRFYLVEGIQHKCMKTEGPWLGRGLEDFIANVPREHLLNQLYMFSKEFSVQEAAERLSELSYVLTTKTLQQDLSTLEQKLKLTLPISNEKKYNYKEDLDESTLRSLREKLQPEYDLLKCLGKDDVG